MIMVGDSFAPFLLTRQIFSLCRLRMATQRSLHIVLLLVMTHIYMMISLTVSLTTLMFSVAFFHLHHNDIASASISASRGRNLAFRRRDSITIGSHSWYTESIFMGRYIRCVFFFVAWSLQRCSGDHHHTYV